jgi:flagellar protein FlaG
MGMQISSLIMGGNLPAVHPQELQDRKEPLPQEKRAQAEQIDPRLIGSKQPTTPDLKKATADLEQVSLAFNRRLKFVIDQESREIIVKVIDNETDKVIKVLPPEELQRLHRNIRETIGFLFDRMV